MRPHVEALSTVLCYVAGDYAGALASAQAVLAESEPGHGLSRGFAIFFRSLAQFALSGSDEAIALCYRIADDPLEEITVRARAMLSIGHICGIACRPVEQERAGLALLKLAQEHGLDVSTAWAHRHLGSAYFYSVITTCLCYFRPMTKSLATIIMGTIPLGATSMRPKANATIKQPAFDQPASFRITGLGHLGDEWADYLRGMTIDNLLDEETPVAAVTGRLPDQAALLGVLNTLYDSHITVLAVENLAGT